MIRATPQGVFRHARRTALALAVAAGVVVAGGGALPANASLPLTFSHMVGRPRHDTPVDVAVDGSGDVYVADSVASSSSANDRVVKYDADGTFLDVLAVPGTAAGQVVNPTSIGIAPDGSIYVSQNGSPAGAPNQISHYDSVGNFIASWGAFGPGNGQFKNPDGVAIDSTGNVYVADQGNNRIQKFTATGTWIASWAVSSPTAVAVDASDNLWVASGGTVFEFDGSGNQLVSFSSTQATGIAVGPAGDIWVASGAGTVRQYTTSGTLLATIGSGELSAPQGIDMQSNAVLYIADTGNGRIVRYSTPTKETNWSATGVTGLASSGGSVVAAQAGGTVATYGTGGAAGASWASNGAQGVAPDGSGNVWVTSLADDDVNEYDASGTLLTTLGSGALLNPRGVSWATNKVFVADTGNNRIVRFALDGTLETSWTLANVKDVVVSGGTVYATDGNNVRAYTTAGVTGASWASAGATGITADGSGNIWVSSSSGLVREYTNGGTYLMSLGTGQLSSPTGVAVVGTKLFVADTGNDRIVRYSITSSITAAWGEHPAPGVMDSPTGIAVNASGDVYVTDKLNDTIQEFALDGTLLNEFGGTGSTNGLFQNPEALAVAPNGNVYVADTGNQRIQEFTADGTYVTQWGSFGASAGMFSSPSGLAIDGSGNVYVSDTGNNRIEVFDASGAYVSGWGSGPATGDGQFKQPHGLAIDGSGDVWVADTGNNRIQQFHSDGTFVGKIAGTSPSAVDGKFSAPRDLDFDAEGTLWVVEMTNNRIQRFASDRTFLTKLGTAGIATYQFTAPLGIAIAPTGEILVADTNNNRVQVFVDENGPDTTFDAGGPGTVSSSTTASFNFHADEPNSTFECKLDGGAYAPCTSGASVNSLTEGAHTFYVRAYDALNNVGNPATYGWTVDVTPPTAGIDSSPNSPTANTNPAFTFHSSEPGSTFLCAVDAATPVGCNSGSYTQSVSNGDHTFSVWAIDPAGNQSALPAQVSWTVDTTPPTVHIDSGPSGYVHVQNAQFTFSSPDSGATFQCHLDGAAYAPCTSPQSYNSLAAGLHTFYVRGTDALGNMSADKTQQWTVDLNQHAPDAWIAIGSKYVGNNVYSATATNEVKTQKTTAGKTVYFPIRIENDGTDTDTYTVSGTGAAKGYKIAYMVSTTNVTTQVVAGTYSFPIGPGTFRVITLSVKVGSTGKTSWSTLVKVKSGHDPSKVDAVKGVVKR